MSGDAPNAGINRDCRAVSDRQSNHADGWEHRRKDGALCTAEYPLLEEQEIEGICSIPPIRVRVRLK